MVVSMSRGLGDARKQFRSLQVVVDHIRSEEMFLQILDREESIPDMAKRLSREAVSNEISSNKRLFLDFLYNLVASGSGNNHRQDVEFAFVIIGEDLMEVDKCLFWFEDLELRMPFEIGEKFGKAILADQYGDVVKKIIAFYKEAEARFDRELAGSLERCSLLVLQEIYPQNAYHISMRLPASILNDYPITI